jgi:hypothetical protein
MIENDKTPNRYISISPEEYLSKTDDEQYRIRRSLAQGIYPFPASEKYSNKIIKKIIYFCDQIINLLLNLKNRLKLFLYL